jgi:hypothetical protein
VPDEVLKLMFGVDAENLIARRIIAMPVREREDDSSLIHDMCIAWENGLLPVFFGSLPSPGIVSQEREARLLLPHSANGTTPDNEPANAAKKSLRKFMSDLRSNPDAALARLVEELESAASGLDAASRTTPVRVILLKFKAGSSDVVHPALVLAEG